jgi:hypothetical protein
MLGKSNGATNKNSITQVFSNEDQKNTQPTKPNTVSGKFQGQKSLSQRKFVAEKNY